MIPIIIICYNNYIYVKNTLDQLLKINKEYYDNVRILDNKSTCPDTIQFLREVDVNVIHNSKNNGPWITSTNNADIYETLPDKFILTDPDLKLNENIPSNFVDIMSELSDKYKVNKIGFALSISDCDKFYKDIYFSNMSIYDWEKQFWVNRIHDNYELYYADIDTTFCLVNKKNKDSSIRIAGNFTAYHLPWYIENDLFNTYEKYISCAKTTSISTIARLIISYTEANYARICKNGHIFLFKTHIDYWKSRFENEAIKILDKYLSKDKVYIDIGGLETCMYGERKSKHLYTNSENILENLKTNCKNYTITNIEKMFENREKI